MRKLNVTEKVALLFKSYNDMKRTGFHTDTAFEEWRDVVAEVRELETSEAQSAATIARLRYTDHEAELDPTGFIDGWNDAIDTVLRKLAEQGKNMGERTGGNSVITDEGDCAAGSTIGSALAGAAGGCGFESRLAALQTRRPYTPTSSEAGSNPASPTPSAQEVELLPCPFCGPCKTKSGRDKQPHEFGYTGPGFRQYEADYCSSKIWIGCDTCKVQMGDARFGFDTEAQAVAAWNTRAAMHKPAMGEWQPIETAPKDGRKIIVYRPLAHMSQDPQVTIKQALESNSYCFPSTIPEGYCAGQHFNSGAAFATHWMPLPAPPASGITFKKGNV